MSVRGPISLPSGLGAGGRGKEKAPCRYLHYEVDWDEGDGRQSMNGKGKELIRRHHRIELGLGPLGSNMRVVSYVHFPSNLMSLMDR